MSALLIWLAYATDLLELMSAGNVERITERLRGFWPWTPVVSLLLLTVETIIPPLPAWPMLIANATIYGIWGGIALSWLGGLMGAISTFWIARTFGRSYVERRLKPEHLKAVDSVSRDKGFIILLLARIFPLTSLDILSFLAGLSSITFPRFLLATAIGLVPSVSTYTLVAHDLLVTRAVTTRMSILIAAIVSAYLAYRLYVRRGGRVRLP